MFRIPAIRCISISRQKLVRALTLLAYLLTALPIPVSATTAREVGTPFPCQGHSCGCQTAEQCWRGCCCFSPEEKLAWARSHGIQPPEYAQSAGGPGWNA